MHVTVVGAGIIGTTTAYRIKRRFPELEISLVAEQFSPNTTSDIGTVKEFIVGRTLKDCVR